MKTEVCAETGCILSASRSRDLLLRFSGGFASDEAAEANSSDSDEIELGLSLGGCFNSPENHKNRILRSSSIPAILPCEVPPLFPLFRTSSLPEEEFQGKTRMEVKRKWDEMRSFGGGGERVDENLKEGRVLKFRRFEVKNEGSLVRSGGPANGVSSPAASRWIAGAGMSATLVKGMGLASQGSVVSEGSNSSGGSELENRSGQGFELTGFSHASETRSPSKFMIFSEQNNHKSPTFSPLSATPTISNVSTSNEPSKGATKMPMVSTKVKGPNGRSIQGFLYKYGRGEEVWIVCVCHGSFLTPAEFVKHGGGGDVAYPLRHIVVNPNSAAFL